MTSKLFNIVPKNVTPRNLFYATVLTAALATAGATSASAASTGWWNGTFVSSGSSCVSGATGCTVKVNVGGGETHSVVIWRTSPVYGCSSHGVADKTQISATGVISKLNNAKVTVAYGSLSNDKTDMVRCNP